MTRVDRKWLANADGESSTQHTKPGTTMTMLIVCALHADAVRCMYPQTIIVFGLVRATLFGTGSVQAMNAQSAMLLNNALHASNTDMAATRPHRRALSPARKHSGPPSAARFHQLLGNARVVDHVCWGGRPQRGRSSNTNVGEQHRS